MAKYKALTGSAVKGLMMAMMICKAVSAHIQKNKKQKNLHSIRFLLTMSAKN